MNRFFTWSWDYSFGTFQTEEEAQADLKRSVDVVLQSGPENLNELDGWCWGELRGTVHKDGTIVPMPPTPDPEAERLRAELADLRKKLHELVLDLSQAAENYRVQYMLTHAEMMDEAADRLADLLETKPADERAD